MKNKPLYLVFTILILVVIQTIDLNAQCAMCRMAAETNLEHGGTSGKGLNAGILYMLSIPYISVSLLAYLLYRRRMKKVAE